MKQITIYDLLPLFKSGYVAMDSRGGNDWSLVEQLDFLKGKCQETLYRLEEMEGVK